MGTGAIQAFGNPARGRAEASGKGRGGDGGQAAGGRGTLQAEGEDEGGLQEWRVSQLPLNPRAAGAAKQRRFPSAVTGISQSSWIHAVLESRAQLNRSKPFADALSRRAFLPRSVSVALSRLPDVGAEQVDYTYTSDDQERGLAKLVEAAVGYDATGPASLGLGAFQVCQGSRRHSRCVTSRLSTSWPFLECGWAMGSAYPLRPRSFSKLRTSELGEQKGARSGV